MIKNVYAVFMKEFKSYFISPIAYVVMYVFLAVTGYYFQFMVKSFNAASMRYYAQPRAFNTELMNLNINLVFVNFFSFISTILLFIVPMLTMRLYSEEKKTGTMELLMTSPITTGQVLWGKFLASFTFFAIVIFLTIPYMGVLILFRADLDFQSIFTGYLGVIFLGSTFIAIGLLASSLTENQIISAALGLFALSFFWLIGWSANQLPAPFSDFMNSLAVTQHFQDFQYGILDTKNVIYYLSVTLFFLYATGIVIESKRWRQ